MRKNKFTSGDKVKIIGTVHYGQDFAFWEGVFPDIVFTVEEVLPSGAIALTASGYGEVCDYGSGAIYLWGDYRNHLLKI